MYTFFRYGGKLIFMCDIKERNVYFLHTALDFFDEKRIFADSFIKGVEVL